MYRILLVAILILALIQHAAAQQNPDGRLPIATAPEPLVLLIHDPEVHGALRLTASQKESVQQLCDQLDPELWRIRNQPADKAAETMERLTATAKQRIDALLDFTQRKRLDQIRLQVRGVKALLNDSVVTKLELTGDQIREIETEVASAEKKMNELRKQAAGGKVSDELQERARQLSIEHQRALAAILTREQRVTWRSLLGEPFDVAALGRITFDAPKLDGVTQWLNSEPLTLEKLKGKVVALHFYAFA